MAMIDFAIPLVIGLLFVFRPELFYKRTNPKADIAMTAKFKKIGYLLIGVAVVYAFVKVVSASPVPSARAHALQRTSCVLHTEKLVPTVFRGNENGAPLSLHLSSPPSTRRLLPAIAG